ncbi:outer membrane biogenesis protein BamB [Planctomycetes bacterium MalM25]|nr:outer membrane biogenesis protein BamB [Planctomycetes bacterium MalM25]
MREAVLRIEMFAAMVLCLQSIACVAQCDESWPQWRGPRRDGIAKGTAPPLRWSATENIVWSAATPGIGHSSPIVFGDRVFLTAGDPATRERLLLAFDRADGTPVWRAVAAVSTPEPMHHKNTMASSTPATNGEIIVTTFVADGAFVAAAFDFDGKRVWTRDFGAFVSPHGLHSPPVIVGDAVLIGGLQDSPNSFVARLSVGEGRTVWRQPTGTAIRSFSPPFYTPGSKSLPECVVISGANVTMAFDFETGSTLWTASGPAEKTVSSIVKAEGLFLVAGGRDGRLIALDSTGQTQWASSKGAPYVSSPLAHNGILHMVSDRGIYTRHDVRTGELYTKQRLNGPTSSSPTLAGGRLYLTDESGRTVVINPSVDHASAKPQVLATNEIGDQVYASPAFVGNELFLRTLNHLHCIREPAFTAAPDLTTRPRTSR